MKERDENVYCYRVEEKTVIPGVMVPTGVMIQGQPEEKEKTGLYLIVEGSSERFIDANGNYHYQSWKIPTSKYFVFEEKARAKALELHRKKQCSSPRCRWTQLEKIWGRK